MNRTEFKFGEWVKANTETYGIIECQFIHKIPLDRCTVDYKGEWIDVHISRIKALDHKEEQSNG